MTITVTPQQAGRTVRSLLHYELGLSTALLNHLKRRKNGILLNGAPVFTNAVVSAGDSLYVDLRDDKPGNPVTPIPMELDIRYEDAFFLVVNKCAPLAVHASSFAPDEPTLAGGLAHYLGPEFVFHPVNRLDRGTTGLMVVAKNRFAHDALRRLLHTEHFIREYRGICLGAPVPAAGVIDLPIGRTEGSPIKRCIRPDGAAAITVYETLERGPELSLLRLLPKTGRTHQLRVHLAAAGHPLVGDWLYGTEEPGRISRPALHAWGLTLRHPVTKEVLSLQADLPEDMKRLMPRETHPGPRL